MPPLPKIPSFSLEGKRALVTGAGRGIGVALAAALSEAGAEVYLIARSAGEVRESAQALVHAGRKAHALVLDVTDHATVERTIADAPPFDILINNAGTNRPKPIGAVTADDYDAVLGLNLKAVYFVTQAVTSRLIAEARPGAVIMISSQMGHVGAANRSLYCASKHAIEGLTKALAIELAPHHIRVNAIAPTFIETPMTRPFLADPDFRRNVLDKIKLGRLGTPVDLMGAVVFLASQASALITGTSIKIDGGWTAG
jgi:NAD(P)-dependent dehydrogenase (short-subunit alcohol dehydrogenase family)